TQNNHIKTLNQLPHTINQIQQSQSFSQKLKQSQTYPPIITQLLHHHQPLPTPNNILPITYLKPITKNPKNINPISIKPQNPQHHHSLI
ncbi:nucleotidyltransferase family protein, partial [Staphylococcus aureus]|uniref:nucleotidyltransferase family protein n=1 Tax=Staphylococcus aureus TaxID=1280 RepID=UPI00164303C4